MKTKELALLLLLIIFKISNSIAQDVVYSQFYANPVYLNPALAGSKLCNRFTVNYRNQWPAANKGYISYSATWDQQFDRLSGGLGILVNSDIGGGGIYNKFSTSGIYSYRLQASRYIVVNAALQTGFSQYRLDWSKLVFGDQLNVYTGEIDPTHEVIPAKLNVGCVDFSAGILGGYKEALYFGVAANHLSMPDISIYGDQSNRLHMRWTFHSGILIDLVEGMKGDNIKNLSIAPNVVYIQQWNFHQLNAGMYVNMYPFVAGLWFRNNFESTDAIIVLLGFQQKQYKIGYSFDYTVSRLGIKAGGAHEISIAWLFLRHNGPDGIPKISTPGF